MMKCVICGEGCELRADLRFQAGGLKYKKKKKIQIGK